MLDNSWDNLHKQSKEFIADIVGVHLSSGKRWDEIDEWLRIILVEFIELTLCRESYSTTEFKREWIFLLNKAKDIVNEGLNEK